jgi:hypothetical protein
VTRRLPARAWIGLAVMNASMACTLARIEPFHSWTTPIAWTGWVLFADGIVWKRRGSSWISDAPSELLALAFLSVPVWIVFEMYNKFCIKNWYYTGLPELLPLRYFGYVWSFATICPAIFQTGELVSSLRDRRADPSRVLPPPAIPLGVMGWASVAGGLALLLWPILRPSPYLAAPVFLGFIFLLDPINARAGDESLRGDVRLQRYGRLVNLALAGAICGVLWELWNYWAAAKWNYAVPILPELRIFEMPVLGYLGFPPFALECFTMYVAARRWLWRGPRRPISL